MVSPNVDRIVKEIEAMTLEERRQLLMLLNSSLAPATPDAEDAVEEDLARAGLLLSRPHPLTEAEAAEYRRWQPIPVSGKPVSQTLIEDRR